MFFGTFLKKSLSPVEMREHIQFLVNQTNAQFISVHIHLLNYFV